MPIGVGSSGINYAPVVQINTYTARTGNGKPAGRDDELFAIVGRPYITTEGLEWWLTTTGIGTSDSKPMAVRLWSRWVQDWVDYTGDMFQPQVAPAQGQAGYRLRDFRVEFRNLQEV